MLYIKQGTVLFGMHCNGFFSLKTFDDSNNPDLNNVVCRNVLFPNQLIAGTFSWIWTPLLMYSTYHFVYIRLCTGLRVVTIECLEYRAVLRTQGSHCRIQTVLYLYLNVSPNVLILLERNKELKCKITCTLMILSYTIYI